MGLLLRLIYSLKIGNRKDPNIPNVQSMRNPMFANYQYQPGSYGGKNRYEDSLDKLKREYKIDYGLGPTYDDVQKFHF